MNVLILFQSFLLQQNNHYVCVVGAYCNTPLPQHLQQTGFGDEAKNIANNNTIAFLLPEQHSQKPHYEYGQERNQ